MKAEVNTVFLIDTNVISEFRKGARANDGVLEFFRRSKAERVPSFLSVVTIGELRRGVEMIRHRGDLSQADMLEQWILTVLSTHEEYILDINCDIAQVWGRLRVPNQENPLDKLIAATALIHGLTIITRNEDDFVGTGAQVLNPFS